VKSNEAQMTHPLALFGVNDPHFYILGPQCCPGGTLGQL